VPARKRVLNCSSCSRRHAARMGQLPKWCRTRIHSHSASFAAARPIMVTSRHNSVSPRMGTNPLYSRHTSRSRKKQIALDALASPNRSAKRQIHATARIALRRRRTASPRSGKWDPHGDWVDATRVLPCRAPPQQKEEWSQRTARVWLVRSDRATGRRHIQPDATAVHQMRVKATPSATSELDNRTNVALQKESTVTILPRP
jgi:hypothetical protein